MNDEILPIYFYDFCTFRVKKWVTDVVYMANCHKLAIASTCRDICFYDVSTNAFFHQVNYVSGSE